MGDYNSSLPIRSEADGTDERVQTKIVDATNPGTQQMEVDTDSNAHVEVHGNNPAGGDEVLRLSEIGALTPDGVYDVANNTKPGNVANILHSRATTPGDANSVIRQTGINSSVNTNVWAADVAIRDENGNPWSETNPLPTTSVDTEGTQVNDYSATTDTAAAASANHDYTVPFGSTFKFTQVLLAASGKMRSIVQFEAVSGSGTFSTITARFNSTANPSDNVPFQEPETIMSGARVRVVKTNLDNQPQNLYSTISGHIITP